MQELSMNILDIAENSTRANASLVEIELWQDTAQNTQRLVIKDNGKGMDAEMVANVTDPFCTTRTTRKVGLGLPFLKMIAEMTGGSMEIQSEVGVGTRVEASFQLNHIDLMPLGDMGSSVSALVSANPDTNFIYRVGRDGNEFAFDTREAREILGDDISFAEPEISLWVREYVNEGTEAVTKPQL